ncbi:MAG: hypothetical protein HOD43_05055 [Candidatus Marinimicrobia bacterium]|jgi:hypothetical protein|nr:hypothetical protein [Candidatus Neomarinimicrobiota bacterium]MBT4132718.1 hypothetical protein [Candidatus Neomarinimicrobiota bacterium]MBT4295156.1 hypothetical protein [Candidatus Neomarinimicrobiota bacterium]MBT4992765.1 hypothetical protein [Candidatus Neomarinimicrobiota bacterium]MBT5465942.1 hypothetical protein [Candidatus Neomarinimicrobiota bacterium]
MKFEPEYKNPLASRIAESASGLDSYFDSKYSDDQLNSGMIVTPAVVVLSLPDDQVDDLLSIKGLVKEGSSDEKAALLLKSLLSDTEKLISEYREENSLSTTGYIPKYEKPIDKIDVVNSSKHSIKVAELLKSHIRDPNLAGIFKIIVPPDFVCSSTDEFGRLHEFINSYQSNIQTQVNQEIPEYLFKLSGDFWEIRYEGEIIRLKDSKGLRYILTLLKNPNKDIRSDQLVAIGLNLLMMQSQDEYSSLGETQQHSNRTLPDVHISVYQDALAKLKSELENLSPSNRGYLEKIQQISALDKMIRSRFDKFGRRRPEDSGEKARQAVSKVIASAKKKIKKEMPEFHGHLKRYLTTGFKCVYDPPPSELKSWHY